MSELLPSSTPIITRNVVFDSNGVAWAPLFCANCGCNGGWTPEEYIKAQGFVSYLCVPCHEKHGAPFGTMVTPDEVFWEVVNSEQMETFGRILSGPEIVEALKDDNHVLSKLAKDRYSKVR